MKLPDWITNTLIPIVLPLAKLIGKKGISGILEHQKDTNPNRYRTIIIVAYRFLKVDLAILAQKTPQKWDDESLKIVAEAIEDSASANNVPLPDVVIIEVPEKIAA